MEKEFIKETRRSVTLNVTAGKIDSFRELEKTTGTVRVYENGCIGVAGCLGEPDESALTAKAQGALSFVIPYPCALEGPLVRENLREEEIIPIPAFIPTMQSFLDRLGEMCPRFAFSNKISLQSLFKTRCLMIWAAARFTVPLPCTVSPRATIFLLFNSSMFPYKSSSKESVLISSGLDTEKGSIMGNTNSLRERPSAKISTRSNQIANSRFGSFLSLRP